jgi:hypothetical protein
MRRSALVCGCKSRLADLDKHQLELARCRPRSALWQEGSEELTRTPRARRGSAIACIG